MLSEISSPSLFDFNGLEQTLEVSSTETLVVVSLDDLEEKGGSILHRLGEDLQEVTLVIVVN